jgi:DHA1 family vesicular acetylcholine transporter-like MFS transporter 3
MSLFNIPILNRILEYPRIAKIREKAQNPETQRRIVLVIVCVALLLDNMLYMVIVPIIPVFLSDMNRPINLGSASYYIYRGEALNAAQVVQRNLTHHPNLTKVAADFIYDLLGWSAQVKATDWSGHDQGSANGVGLLFASKAIVQLFISPFAGPIIDRMGYERPMIVGLSVLFLSTAIFAFGRSYGVLFLARSLQGVGSAFADTAGLAMIADRFKEPGERSKAQGIALAFISFGSLFAPPFGGFLYEFAGKAVPFLALSFIALVDGIMLLFIMQPYKPTDRPDIAVTTPTSFQMSLTGGEKKDPAARPLHGTPIYRLILDPYIAICAGALVVANINLAFLEPTIATWMKDSMNAEEWKIGLVWLPAFFPHVLGVYVTVKLMRAFPKRQWVITAVGLVLEGASCLLIPFCTNFAVVILPLMIDCFGIALVDTAILPTLAYLVDVRHVSVYGSVYAIADVSYSLAYAFGPVIADWIYSSTSFLTLNIVIFLASALYAPIMALLRNVYKYENFENDDEDVDGATPLGVTQTGYVTSSSSEAKPIAAAVGGSGKIAGNGTDYRSYMMMNKMAPASSGNGSALQDGLPVYNGGDGRQIASDGDVNRKYVHVGRARSSSRDSDDNGEFRTYH